MNHKDPTTEVITTMVSQLTWEYTPEDISWKFNSFADTDAKAVNSKWRKEMAWPGWKMLKKSDDDDSATPAPAPNPFGIAQRVSWVPALGPKMWESEATAKFNAYIYRSPDGKIIGYVRIPHYESKYS